MKNKVFKIFSALFPIAFLIILVLYLNSPEIERPGIVRSSENIFPIWFIAGLVYYAYFSVLTGRKKTTRLDVIFATFLFPLLSFLLLLFWKILASAYGGSGFFS